MRRAANRALRLLRSVADPRPYVHLFRVLHFYNYAHLAPRRRATLASSVSMAPNVSLRNGERLSIGERTHVGERCSLWAGDGTGRIDIGSDVLFGPSVFVTASNYRVDDPDTPIMRQPRAEATVRIGDDVWLGTGAIVLPGVSIGSGAVVAAGAVVTGDVAPRTVVAGVPARAIAHRPGSPSAEEPPRGPIATDHVRSE